MRRVLRAVNVGKRTTPMVTLKALAEGLCHTRALSGIGRLIAKLG